MKALARLFNALTSERLHRTNQIPLAPRVLAFKSLFGSSSQKILKQLGVQVIKKFQLYQGRQAARLYNDQSPIFIISSRETLPLAALESGP